MNPDTLLLSVNAFARATPRLHGPLTLSANDGIVVFAGLLIAGCWIARRDRNSTRMATAWWAPLGTLLAGRRGHPLGWVPATSDADPGGRTSTGHPAAATAGRSTLRIPVLT